MKNGRSGRSTATAYVGIDWQEFLAEGVLPKSSFVSFIESFLKLNYSLLRRHWPT
jgi:hypothetical protein